MDSHGVLLLDTMFSIFGSASRFAHLAASAVHRTVHTLDISADSADSAASASQAAHKATEPKKMSLARLPTCYLARIVKCCDLSQQQAA